jgi:antitoxin ParD1/3/4
MQITLPAELEKLVNEKIESGSYDTPIQVLRDGLRLLNEQDQIREIRREELRREIQKGIDDIREGRSKRYDSAEELVDDIIRRGKERLAEKNGKG